MASLSPLEINNFSEDDLINGLRSLIVLMNVGEKFASTFDLKLLFQSASDGIVQLSGLDSSAFYLVENEEIYLASTTPALPPNFPEELRRARLEDHPHIRKSINQNEIVTIRDVENAVLTIAEKEVCEMRNLRSVLYFPIKSRKQMEGVLIVASCENQKEIDNMSIGLCKTLVHYVSIAIVNARYHDQLTEYANQLEEQVKERTERLNMLVDSMAGREIRMAELKKVIRQLRKQITDLGYVPNANDPLIEQLQIVLSSR